MNSNGVGRTPEPGTTAAPAHHRRRILLVSLAFWAGSFLYLTLTPDLPRLGSVDSNAYAVWGHLVGTMGLAVILYLLVVDSQRVSRRTAALGTIVAASAFGVVIEILQGLTGTRDPAISDAMFDALGATIAVGLVALVPGWVRPVTSLTVVGTALFTAATIVAAVFFTPGAVGNHDCSVSNITHHAPAPSPPSTDGSRTAGGSSRSTGREPKPVRPSSTRATSVSSTCTSSSQESSAWSRASDSPAERPAAVGQRLRSSMRSSDARH